MGLAPNQHPVGTLKRAQSVATLHVMGTAAHESCHPNPRPQQAGVVDGPLLGNGDLGAALGGVPAAQGLFLGKSDMWATNTVVGQRAPQLHSDTFYTQVPGRTGAVGRCSLAIL